MRLHSRSNGARVLCALAAFSILSACAPFFGTDAFVAEAHAHIDHVIIIVQENRSFDNLFHGYPGADTADVGLAHDGTRVPLKPISLKVAYDLSNGFQDFEHSYDHGKMDGWDLRRIGPRRRAVIPLAVAQYPQYGFVPPTESRPYFDMAKQYVLADRMFQSNIDQSFAAHLYLIAGQAGHATNIPSGRPWGCDAFAGTVVATLTDKRKSGKFVFPCFDFKTLGDELDARQLPWRYYAPQLVSGATWHDVMRNHVVESTTKSPDFGQLWTSYDAVAHDRYGPTWGAHIVSPEAQVLRDIQSGSLANVSWVIPDWKDSDHSLAQSDSGPSWVSSIVNAVGKSKYWSSTAIFVTWDDSGGWYDHVPPPQLDYDGLGIRVPLLVISPYAKRGHVTHAQYEFGSILRFTEDVFGLDPLAASDRRARPLEDCFDFHQSPRHFEPIAAPYGPAYFLREAPSVNPPDYD